MNKIIKNTVILLLAFTMVSITNSASAASDDKVADCVKPRFRSIKPPKLSELEPESEFSFTLPEWSNPNKVKVTVKKLDAVVKVEDHKSFYLVKVTLPAQLRDTYARVDVRAEAKLGCYKYHGWLYKILGAEPEQEVQTEEKQQETSKQQPASEKEGKPESQ